MGSVDIYPPSQPSGMALGYAEVTANQTGITTEVDLTGLTVTVTVPAGRRIKITGHVGYFNDTVNGGFLLNIKEGATVLNRFISYETQASNGVTNHAEAVILPTAGTHTYKLTGTRAVVGTVTVEAAATIPSFILVEDITGTIYPAGTLVTAGIIASEAWTSYTPVWTSSGTAVSLGNGTLLGRYIRLGRTVIGAIYFSPGGTTTFGTGNYAWSIPVAPSNSLFNFQIVGSVKGYNGGANCNAVATINGGPAAIRAVYSATWPAGSETQFGQLTPWTWVSGNDITIEFTYEAAT